MKSIIAILALSTAALASTIPPPCNPTPKNPYCGMDMHAPITTADLMQSGLVKFGH